MLAEEIRSIYLEYSCVFGVRKITALVNQGRENPVNHKRVERIMKEQKLASKTKKRYVVTTNSNHKEPIHPNLLNRDFTAEKPRTKLVSDTTEYRTNQGKFYIAVILDLYGRKPLGLAMSLYNDSKLKSEWLDRRFRTNAEAMRAVYEYVWYFYPKVRPHASNNYMTPLEYYSNYVD